MNLNEDTFLVQEKGKNAINRLTFKYEGTTPYQTKLLLHEFSSKIVKFLCEKGHLYTLSKRGEEYFR